MSSFQRGIIYLIVVLIGTLGIVTSCTTCLTYEKSARYLLLRTSFCNKYSAIDIFDNNGKKRVGCTASDVGRLSCFKVNDDDSLKIEYNVIVLYIKIPKNVSTLNGRYVLRLDQEMHSLNVNISLGISAAINIAIRERVSYSEGIKVFELQCSTCWTLKYTISQFVIKNGKSSTKYGVYLADGICYLDGIPCDSSQCSCGEEGKSYISRISNPQPDSRYECHMRFNESGQSIDKIAVLYINETGMIPGVTKTPILQIPTTSEFVKIEAVYNFLSMAGTVFVLLIACPLLNIWMFVIMALVCKVLSMTPIHEDEDSVVIWSPKENSHLVSYNSLE